MRKANVFINTNPEPVVEVVKQYRGFLLSIINAKTPSRHKKKKNYIVGVSTLGIFVMRKKRTHKTVIVRFFIPIESITEITRIEDLRISILSKESPTPREFESKHINILVKTVCEAFSRLQFNKAIPLKIKFSGFPMPSPSIEIPKSPPANLIITRYLCQCAKYNTPVNDTLYQLFESFQDTSRTSIGFTRNCGTIAHPNTIVIPLMYEPDLASIFFDCFCPRLVCRIIHKLLKYNKRIRHISLIGYKLLRFEHLNFSDIDNPSMVSLTLDGIELDDVRKVKFFIALSQYRGDFQNLTITNIPFKLRTADRLGFLLATEHCFRTLEILTVNNVKAEENDPIPILNSLLFAIRRLSVLRSFISNGWQEKFVFQLPQSSQPIDLVQSDSLRILLMSNIDFRLLARPIRFPKTLRHLELPNCVFTGKSLHIFMEAVSKYPEPFSLFLGKIKITQVELSAFFKFVNNMPPLTNICQFDWSHNPIPEVHMKEFCRFFLSENIKMVNLTGCFKTNKLDQLIEVLQYLATTKVWGIELRGTEPEAIYKDEIEKLFPYLLKIKTLEHLNISNQQFDSKIAHNAVRFIRDLKGLSELLMDGTLFESRTPLYGFYQVLYELPQIKSIQRPVSDLARIIDNNTEGYTFEMERVGPRWTAFKNKIISYLIPQDKYARTEFFVRNLDVGQYLNFMRTYPISCQANSFTDRFSINIPDVNQANLRSLTDNEMGIIEDSLGNFQNSLFDTPYDVEHEQVPEPFVVPDIINDKKNIKITISRDFVPPVVRKTVNIEKVVSKYGKFIKKENRQLFKNLNLIDQYFFKTSLEENQTPLASSIVVVKPPIQIEDEEFDVVLHKIEELHEDDEVSESSVTFSTNKIQFSTTQLLGNTQYSNKLYLSENVSDSILNVQTTSTNEASEMREDYSEEVMQKHSPIKVQPTNIPTKTIPQRNIVAQPMKSRFIPITTPPEDATYFIMQKTVFEKTLEEIADEINNTQQKELLNRLRNSQTALEAEDSIRMSKIPIPSMTGTSGDRSTISPFLSQFSQKLCTTVTSAPSKQKEAQSINIPSFDTADEEQNNENALPVIQVSVRQRSSSINKLPTNLSNTLSPTLLIPVARSNESDLEERKYNSEETSSYLNSSQVPSSDHDDKNSIGAFSPPHQIVIPEPSNTLLTQTLKPKITSHQSMDSISLIRSPSLEPPGISNLGIPPISPPKQETPSLNNFQTLPIGTPALQPLSRNNSGVIGAPPLLSSGGSTGSGIPPALSNPASSGIPPPLTAFPMSSLTAPSTIPLNPLASTPPPLPSLKSPPVSPLLGSPIAPPPLAPISGSSNTINRSGTLPPMVPLSSHSTNT